MAAMVLTSLSCSPVVQSPPGGRGANFSGEERGRRWVLGAAEASSLSEFDASVLSPQFPPLGEVSWCVVKMVECETEPHWPPGKFFHGVASKSTRNAPRPGDV